MTLEETKDYLSTLEMHLPGLLVSVSGTEEGDKLHFRYNKIGREDKTIFFAKDNSFDKVSFPTSYIEKMEHDDDTIRIDLKNGERFVACINEKANIPAKNTPIDLDDLLEMLHRTLAISARYEEQNIGARFTSANIKIKDSDDDLDWGGDRLVKLTVGRGENFLEISLTEESIFKLVREDENHAVVMLDLEEMPFFKLMLTLTYTAIEMNIPVDLLEDLIDNE